MCISVWRNNIDTKYLVADLDIFSMKKVDG